MITIDNRPNSQLVMLVDDTTWTILASVGLNNVGASTTYVNPSVSYEQFLQVLTFFKTQTLTAKEVLVDQNALALVPLISRAYYENAVPPNMDFTLVASVQGFNGNANVNKVTFGNTMLSTLDSSVLTNTTSIVLTISP